MVIIGFKFYASLLVCFTLHITCWIASFELIFTSKSSILCLEVLCVFFTISAHDIKDSLVKVVEDCYIHTKYSLNLMLLMLTFLFLIIIIFFKLLLSYHCRLFVMDNIYLLIATCMVQVGMPQINLIKIPLLLFYFDTNILLLLTQIRFCFYKMWHAFAGFLLWCILWWLGLESGPLQVDWCRGSESCCGISVFLFLVVSVCSWLFILVRLWRKCCYYLVVHSLFILLILL